MIVNVVNEWTWCVFNLCAGYQIVNVANCIVEIMCPWLIFVPAASIEFGKNGLPHDYLTLPPKPQSSTRVRHDFTILYLCGCYLKVIGTDYDGLQYRTPMTKDFEILWGHTISLSSTNFQGLWSESWTWHIACIPAAAACANDSASLWWSNSVTGNIDVGCAKGLRAELKCWFFSNMFLFPHAF